VLAIDISQEMLDVAARFAQQEGLRNITTRVMNAEQLDLPESSFDAVISRFGLMLIPQQQQALREIRRVLKPGGRVAGLVWSKPERNPLFTLEIETIRKYGEAAEDQPDVFSLADEATFIRGLTEVGFREVQVHALPQTFRFPSFEALTAWWGPLFDRTLARLEREPGQHVYEEIRQAVRQFERSEGIVAPAEVLLGVGMK
jgi:ubiquinone/menaquinone biosynthesis C-methylase UbiE